MTAKTKDRKSKLVGRTAPRRSDKPWKFTLTLMSEGKRVSVRGVFQPSPVFQSRDDGEGYEWTDDYIITVKDMEGNVVSEMVCWDQDDAVVDAAINAFARWTNMA